MGGGSSFPTFGSGDRKGESGRLGISGSHCNCLQKLTYNGVGEVSVALGATA